VNNPRRQSCPKGAHRNTPERSGARATPAESLVFNIRQPSIVPLDVMFFRRHEGECGQRKSVFAIRAKSWRISPDHAERFEPLAAAGPFPGDELSVMSQNGVG
jgi:hypothetical protein